MQFNNQQLQLLAAIQDHNDHNELFALSADPAALAQLADAQEHIIQDLQKEPIDEANAIKAAIVRDREDADAELAVLDARIAELQDQWGPWKEELAVVMFASW